MAKYLEIPEGHVEQATERLVNWFAIQPIETGDGRWVVPVKAVKQLRDELIPKYKKSLSLRTRLIKARDYLERRTVLDESEIVWKEYEEEINN
jgi:hypothetical protein